MKVKSFDHYLATRLNDNEIKQIEQAAQLEFETLQALKADISKAVIHYMNINSIGFNDVVRKLGKSPSQVSKIIKGEANLTLATIAQIFAMMGQKPRISTQT